MEADRTTDCCFSFIRPFHSYPDLDGKNTVSTSLISIQLNSVQTNTQSTITCSVYFVYLFYFSVMRIFSPFCLEVTASILLCFPSATRLLQMLDWQIQNSSASNNIVSRHFFCQQQTYTHYSGLQFITISCTICRILKGCTHFGFWLVVRDEKSKSFTSVSVQIFMAVYPVVLFSAKELMQSNWLIDSTLLKVSPLARVKEKSQACRRTVTETKPRPELTTHRMEGVQGINEELIPAINPT